MVGLHNSYFKFSSFRDQMSKPGAVIFHTEIKQIRIELLEAAGLLEQRLVRIRLIFTFTPFFIRIFHGK
jgi:hypothetical protein